MWNLEYKCVLTKEKKNHWENKLVSGYQPGERRVRDKCGRGLRDTDYYV